MTNRFCPKCGATISEGIFCKNCVVKELQYGPPLVQVSEFNRTIHKGRWIPFNNLDEVIIKRVQEALGKKIPVTLEPFEFEIRPKNKATIHAKIMFNGQEVTLPVRLSYMQCDFGQKEKTEYYEGILQLRNSSDAVFNFIDKELKKVAIKGVFITKTVETKSGVDLYMTNKSYLRLLAQKIHAKFGGKITLNAQLFSHNHQTSKDIFRLNVLMELPSFQPGDVIVFFPISARRKDEEKKIVLVKGLGKIIQGIDLITGKSIAFEFKFAKGMEVVKQDKTRVVAVTPEVLILHPETFQAVPIVNQELFKNALMPDDEIYVAQSEHGLVVVKKA